MHDSEKGPTTCDGSAVDAAILNITRGCAALVGFEGPGFDDYPSNGGVELSKDVLRWANARIPRGCPGDRTLRVVIGLRGNVIARCCFSG
jgi:hypothetical protein